MNPPEPGQQVHVRGGAYLVQDVAHTPAETQPDGSRKPASTYLRLASLQEEVFGEALEVIWELEPGATVREQNQMPEPNGFDDPARLDAFLDAVRWGAVVQADHSYIQSPYRSGITPEFYQLDPVVRAVTMPRANLLIADDVGLGKTIEAGLVLQELMIRGRARSIFIVCPSALQVQWQEQMRDKFGLTFQIVDSAMLHDLRRKRGPRANPWNSYPRLITSIDYIKRPNPYRLLQDVLGASPGWRREFDVLVVDEAHCVAPSSTGKYAVDSQRTRAVRKLARHFEHKLFLTATPHNGDPNSWTALLELLDDQRFTRGVLPAPEQLQRVMIRRMKSQITDDLKQKRFKDRIIQELVVDYSDGERQLHRYLGDYAAGRAAKAKGKQQEYAVAFVMKLLKKRLFSSPGSFHASIEHHARQLQQRKPAGDKRKRIEQGLRILRKYLDDVDDEDFADDDAYDAAVAEKLDLATEYQPPLDETEQDLLNALLAGAKRAASRADSKAALLLDWLERHLRPEGKWNDERVIIFTEYRHTLAWLQNLLAAHKFTAGQRTLTIYGGMQRDEREAVKAAFQAHPDISSVRILLATDAAGEGLDLQNHCRYLIHYEIPWNPNRLEQRNGRIDRHGQTRAPRIFHFVGAGFDRHRDPLDLRAGSLEGDLEFLAVAALKVNKIREDLGVVGPVIAANIEQAMLGGRATLDTRQAEQTAAATKGNLAFERDQRRRIDELETSYRRSARALGIGPEAIERVVRTGLDLAGHPPLVPHKLNRSDRPVFHIPHLTGGWAACSDGLAHPHSGDIRPITFDPSIASGHDDVVLAHLGHQLVELCLRLLRAEVWAAGDGRKLFRVCARALPENTTANHPHLIVHARLVMIGATHQRLHEELLVAGGTIQDGLFRVAARDADLAVLLAAATDREPPEILRQKLAELFPQHRDKLARALATRVARRAARLTEHLAEQCRQECRKVEQIFDELQQALHRKLAEDPAPAQLALFDDDERDQLTVDRAALERRHRNLPEERRRELAATRARFDQPTSRCFPVAITWLVPPSYLR